jgi:putative hydrolase of the HAD superfamily
MTKLEEKGFVGIKGLIFELYNTLIDIKTNERSIETYEPISKCLIPGVKISAEDLKNEFVRLVK